MNLSPKQQQLCDHLVEQALALRISEREDFVRTACGDDETLRREVSEILSVSSKSLAVFEARPVSEPASGLSPGDVLGHQFAVDDLVGAGGMGRVYRARDLRLQRYVAIKILSEGPVIEPHRRGRFEREARAVAALNHAHICAVYQFGTDRELDYIVLEYLEGRTLRDRLADGPLNSAEWKRVAVEIAGALEYAHQQGVIHRDLKPANIMLTPGGAKLLDFSIAKYVGVQRSTTDSTTSTGGSSEGLIVGTAAYMSPEQAEGLAVDERSDIFSFGCVLHEMITGRHAFAGGSELAILAAVLRGEAPRLKDSAPGSSARVQSLIDRCLQKRPGDRFQSMSEVCEAIVSLEDRGDIRSSAVARRSLVAALSLVSAGGLGFLLRRAWQHSLEHTTSVFVLPFTNVSKNPEMEYVVDGLAEALRNTLSRSRGIRVIAQSVAITYTGGAEDIRKIEHDLNVDSVVMGRATFAAGKMRVQTELVDARTGMQLWGQQYEGTVNDALKIRNDLVRQVSERLQGKAEFIQSFPTTQNAEAFQLYLRGRHALNRYSVTDLQRAIGFFDKALETDPNYALAYAALADCYWSLSGSAIPPREAFPKAKTAAQRAALLDPGLAQAHVALGVVLCYYDFRPMDGQRELRRAIELDPNDATARIWLANALSNGALFEEAIAQAKIAHQLDPLSPFIETGLAQMYYFAGQPLEAIRRLRNVVGADPPFYNGHFFLGVAYLQAQQYAKAIGEFKEAERLDDTQPFAIGHLAYAYAMAGDRATAQEYLRALKRFNAARYVPKYLYAIISLGMGDRKAAVQFLRQSYQDRDDMIALMKVDHLLDPLRSMPEFAALVSEIRGGEEVEK